MNNFIKKIKWLFPYFKSIFHLLILIIFFSSAYSIASVYRAYVSKSLIDSTILGDKSSIIKWVVILGVLLIADILFKSLNSIISTYTSGKLSNTIQSKLYKHIMYTKWSEHSKYHSVNLMTRIINDVDTITSLLVTTLPNILSLGVMLVSAFTVLLYFEPTMAYISIAIFPLSILVSKICGSKIKKYYIALQEQEIKYRSFIQETLQNITIVKSFCTEEKNISNIKSIQKDRLKLSLKRNNIGLISNVFLQIGSWLGYFCVFGWGAMNLSKSSNNFGTLTALLQLFGNIQGPFAGLSQCFPQIINAFGAIERITEIESFEIENHSTCKNQFIDYPPTINFENVSFSYSKAVPILKNISLVINPGETVGIVGPSGEGKTTLIRLLLNLIEPTKGKITLSNSTVKETLNYSHRELMAYVPQGNTLFSGTIKSNISYGNEKFNDYQVLKAAEKSCSIKFISTLDKKFLTPIGERGEGISEGQAQRISLARAFIKNKPILILDESTSALDKDTEIKVLKSIESIENKPTCILITHRPSALNICDKIIEIKNGSLKIIKNSNIKIVNN